MLIYLLIIFFFKKNKFHGYIDFYFACNDFFNVRKLLFVSMHYVSIKKNNKFIFNKKKSTNLIRGYSKIRKFSDKEKKIFKCLV